MSCPTEYTLNCPGSPMIAMPCLGFWVAMVPERAKLAADRGALAGSWDSLGVRIAE